MAAPAPGRAARGLRRARAEARHAVRRARRGLRSARKRVRKQIQWFGWRPVVELLRPLDALGIPVVAPYAAGSRWLARIWALPAVERRLVRRVARSCPEHPVAGRSGPLRADERERFFSSLFLTTWRLNALARCPDEVFRRCVSLEGPEHVEKARAAGRGVIFASAHHGAAEAMSVALGRVGIAPHCFAAVEFERRLLRGRSGWPLQVIVRAPGRASGLRAMAQARAVLKGRGAVLILADGGKGQVDVELPFLGGTQRFAQGFATLALVSGAPVVPVFGIPGPQGRVAVRFLPPLDAGAPEWPRSRRIRHLVAQYARHLEERLLEDPLLIKSVDLEGMRRHGSWDAAALRAAATSGS